MKKIEKTVVTENGEQKIAVKAYYTPSLIKAARDSGAKWNGSLGAWLFDLSDDETVNNILYKLFGWEPNAPLQYCSLIVGYEYLKVGKRPVVIFDRLIASASQDKSTSTKLGADIVCLDGKYYRDGSWKNWETVIEGDFEIKNVLVERTKAKDIQEAIEAGWCEIKYYQVERTEEEILSDIKRYEDIIQNLKKELEEVTV